MVAQFATKGNHTQPISVERQLPNVHASLNALVGWIYQSANDGTAAHEVERGLFDRLLALGKTLFDAFLKLVGPGDFGPSVSLDDGHLVHRSQEEHTRRLVTVFGECFVSRWVYAPYDKAKVEFAPTDQRLQLPASDISYLLQEWDQLLGVEQAFGQVRETIQTILRLTQSVATLERTNQQMAEAAPVFRESQGPVDMTKEEALLVVTEDNKGIPMVRPVEETPAGAHRTKGEKANKKQMACIGCVYSVARHPRTPEQLVATLFRDPDRSQEQPPQAQNKRYWAELSRELDGEEVRGQDLVFQHLQAEVKMRRQSEQWLVHLCDGQASLETDRQEYLPSDAYTLDILDLMHVLPRVWEAAHVFHAEASDAASDFVRRHVTRILRGEVGNVIAAWRRTATIQGLTGAKNKNLRTLCAFLEKNRHRMRYDEYLRLGCPIATGVIEGACRHVIKDRMERAGMRWKIPGAQAMLNLRTIRTNGDWTAFQDFRIALENEWLYPNTKAFHDQEWQACQAA
ncbi:MAG: ISKra4 family transposase [Blastocatellia bacterium]|nr:ISKra4 family transposase [Blastocatellia bacterium]